MSRSIRRAMIDRDHQQLSLVRQCILLDVSRASVYYRPVPTRAEDLELMALMDRQYLKTPFYGSRKMKAWLLQQGYLVSRKRVRRLMRLMGLEAIYRRPNTSKPAPGHRIFPYLLKGVEVNRVDQVWAADITYIPMAKGFLYLVAIMDWHSRHVLAWKLSNTMDTSFCVAALEEALGKGRPEIFNTDQGSQFTSEAFTQTLQEQRVQVSMDGKGRYLDNKFFDEDFHELKEAGYLLACVPTELGGLGLNLAQVCQEQRRLGYHAAATALAVNMHFYWTGLAADVWRSGDMSTEWMLKAAADGEIFAAGHAEGGNDIPVLLSTTKAEKVDGGYKFTGRKSFGSLTPVWTYLGLHGMDTSNADAPKIVHAFMPRDSSGYKIENVWDTLGMRATQSQDTVLDGAFVPDKYITRVVDGLAASICSYWASSPGP